MVTRKKRSRARFSPLGKIITKSIKNLGISLKFDQQKVTDNWSQIVGEQIDSISRTNYFKFKTLFVEVSDPIWLQQLVFLEDEIKEKINRYIKKKLVQKIHFKVGELPEKTKAKTKKNQNMEIDFLKYTDQKDEKETDSALAPISDPELKIILKRIMMKGKGADKSRCR